jgi:membrane associated rhomboid family serine protease
MELDPIAWWVAVASSVFVLARLARTRSGGWGWAAVCALILAVAIIGTLVLPDQAGLIAGVLWLVFLVVPLRLTQLSGLRIIQQRFAAARFYAGLARLLHPLDGLWMTPVLIDALALGHQGNTAEAAVILTRLRNNPRASRRMVLVIQAQLARLAWDWAAIPALVDAVGTAGLLPASMRLRAFGETGRLHDLVAGFQAVPHAADSEYQLCLLFLFAFCGRRHAVADLVDGPLAALDPDTRQFWLATAELAGGGSDSGLSVLASSDRQIRHAARRRLETPLPRADVLDAAELRVIAEAEAAMRRDADFRDVASTDWRRCYVVLALIVLNVAGFVAEELVGGSDSTRALYRLGALWPAAVTQGEWWRLAAASFLHAGPVHLAVNMLALAVVGPWVEWIAGHWRFALIYAGSGIGSMAAVQVLMRHGIVTEGLLVGASGAIFGVVGAQVMLLLEGFRRLGSRLAGRRLAAMGLVIGVQVVFDLTTPQVSFAAHASGFAIGIGVTALLVAMPGARR